MGNELLVGTQAICKRFKISRARLLYWESLGAPVYRRGVSENAPMCADYHGLLGWEQTVAAAHWGRMKLPADREPQLEAVW